MTQASPAPAAAHTRTRILPLQIELTEAEWTAIGQILAWSQDQTGLNRRNSHGPLTLNLLVTLLLEDVAMCVTRPASWEGSYMLTVMQAHGY